MPKETRSSQVNPYSPPTSDPAPEVVVAQTSGDYPIELDYEVQIDDLVSLSVFHHSRSHMSRSTSLLRRILIAFLLFMLSVPVLMVLPRAPTESVTGIITLLMLVTLPVMAVAYFFLYPTLLRRRIRSQVIRMYSEGSNTSVMGWHRLVISPEGLEFETKVARHSYKWAGVERIEMGESALYFYLSAVSAQIVPLRSFDNDEEAQRFFELSQRYCAGVQ